MPQTRPEKYPPILHSEENAVLNSTGSLENATAYITGPPCTHCWAHIIQKRIKRVVYGPITTSAKGLYASATLEKFDPVVEAMLENHDIEVVRWEPKDIDLILRELEELKNLVLKALRPKCCAKE